MSNFADRMKLILGTLLVAALGMGTGIGVVSTGVASTAPAVASDCNNGGCVQDYEFCGPEEGADCIFVDGTCYEDSDCSESPQEEGGSN